MFLWWNKSCPKEYLFELDMCIHVFGGTSFLSCSNYALIHATADNEKQFGLFIHSSIIQMLCKDNFSWEEKIAQSIGNQWPEWILKRLNCINIPRCYKFQKFGEIKDCSIYHFSDASKKRVPSVQLLVTCRQKFKKIHSTLQLLNFCSFYKVCNHT